MKGMSEREYAAHSGLSRCGVQKARKNGRLTELGGWGEALLLE